MGLLCLNFMTKVLFGNGHGHILSLSVLGFSCWLTSRTISSGIQDKLYVVAKSVYNFWLRQGAQGVTLSVCLSVHLSIRLSVRLAQSALKH